MFDVIIAFIRWLFGREEYFEEVMPFDPMVEDYLDELEISPTKTTVSTNVLELPQKCQTHPLHRKIE